MKKDQFHIPFLKNLVAIALVTIVSMISVRIFLEYGLNGQLKNTHYTIQKSQISPNR